MFQHATVFGAHQTQNYAFDPSAQHRAQQQQQQQQQLFYERRATQPAQRRVVGAVPMVGAGNHKARPVGRFSLIAPEDLIDMEDRPPQRGVQQQQQQQRVADEEDDDPVLAPSVLGAKTEWSTLDLAHNDLLRVSPLLARFDALTALHLQHNLLASLPSELASLRHLKMLDLSRNRLRAVPPCVCELVSLETLLLNGNRIRELPFLMGRLCRLCTLAIDDTHLITTPPPDTFAASDPVRAPIEWLRDRMPIGAHPADRLFLDVPDEIGAAGLDARARPVGAGLAFRVCCFNVLAENYASPERVAYCPSWALAWTYRREVIVSALLQCDADVLCLQEVESLQYRDFFVPKLADFDSVFLPKSRVRNSDKPDRVDGCATFFRRSRFTLVREHHIEYQSVAMKRYKEFDDERALQRLLGRDNVALLVALRFNQAPQQVVIVSNTHIHWNPQMCDVKLMQVALMVERIEQFARELGFTPTKPPPLVVCGDFNMTPESGAYRLLAAGALPRAHADFAPPDSGDPLFDAHFAANGSQRDSDACKFHYGAYTRDGVKHDLQLASAYAFLNHPFTNFTDTFSGCLDYVFLSKRSIRLRKVLAPLTEDDVRLTCLPSPFWGSDHVPICAELELAL
jgi:CCR4-NOT transcription complex subunit 6